MQCPVCKNRTLAAEPWELELQTLRCPQCRGRWIKSYQYWKWRDQHGPDLPQRSAEHAAPLPVNDTGPGKLCPECGRFITHYAIGHDVPFHLDRCSNCGGIWFDNNEWEILESRNLHDDVHYIFSEVWQAAVIRAERQQSRQQQLESRLGPEDLAELKRTQSWINSHEKADVLLAYLMYDPPRED